MKKQTHKTYDLRQFSHLKAALVKRYNENQEPSFMCLLCQPPIIASTVKVPLGSRWLLEHLPSPLKARHQEGGSREGQMGCLSFKEPSKIFCPQTSACLVARNVHTPTPSLKGAWQMWSTLAHCHPDIHQGSSPKGRKQNKDNGQQIADSDSIAITHTHHHHHCSLPWSFYTIHLSSVHPTMIVWRIPFSTLYRQGNRDSQELSNLHKVTELKCGPGKYNY